MISAAKFGKIYYTLFRMMLLKYLVQNLIVLSCMSILMALVILMILPMLKADKQ